MDEHPIGSTGSGPQGSSGANQNQREHLESARRGGDSGGDRNQEYDGTPPQSPRHQQDAQHPNQWSTSRRRWWQNFLGGRPRTPHRQQAEDEEKEREQDFARADDAERELHPLALGYDQLPESPNGSRQQGDAEHRNQSARRARSARRPQGRRIWEHMRSMTPGRQRVTRASRGGQQVDARRVHSPAGFDRNPTPGGGHGDLTREEKTAGFYDAVEDNHPPPLATTPRRSRRIFHEGAQTPGRLRGAPVGPRLRDENEEANAQRRARWEKAVAAVDLRATRDKDEVDGVQWPDRGEPEDVCTQAPSTSKVRVTLFLQTGQRAREHANVLKAIFPHSVVLVSQKIEETN